MSAPVAAPWSPGALGHGAGSGAKWPSAAADDVLCRDLDGIARRVTPAERKRAAELIGSAPEADDDDRVARALIEPAGTGKRPACDAGPALLSHVGNSRTLWAAIRCAERERRSNLTPRCP
jgi:hypothetical protein